MPAVTFTPLSGDQDIDGLLVGVQWAVSSLTYSFPASGGFYGVGYSSANEQLNNFETLNPVQRAVVRTVIEGYASVTALSFPEVTESATVHGDLRLAESDDPSTAWGYYPHPSAAGGDSWYNNSGGKFDNPVKGNYAHASFIHELGHNLGLKHGHEDEAMSVEHDSMEYSVMTYRSYVGQSTTGPYTNEPWGYAQTLMMYDVAALQHMYGANYGTNAGNTTYSWNPATGECSVNGAGQGAPGGNRVFMTLWDGGGVDTYNFSNYSTAVNANLSPGAWTTTSQVQLAYLGAGHYAVGNVANALLHDGDLRSLIENVSGGAGGDTLTGNQAANVIYGNGGDDRLDGQDGADILDGGDGADALEGRGGNDTLHGRLGDDTLSGGSNDDTLWGESGDDLMNGDAGNDRLEGEDGADTLDGGDGLDLLEGRAGNDTLYGAPGDDTLSGGANDDMLWGGSGNDLIYGDPGNDWLEGQDGADILEGGDGSDLLEGRAGNDTLYGRLGNDTLSGGGDADALWGGDGDDLVYGDPGNDRLEGQDGADILDGGDGSDLLEGRAGSDTLHGALGDDTLSGGEDQDTLWGQDGNDLLYGDGGNDMLAGGGGADLLAGGSGSDRFYFNAIADGIDTITDFARGVGNDVLDIGDVLVGYVQGSSNVSSFVQLAGSGGNTLVRVNADGAGSDFVQVATLQYVTGLLLNDMLAQGNLSLT